MKLTKKLTSLLLSALIILSCFIAGTVVSNASVTDKLVVVTTLNKDYPTQTEITDKTVNVTVTYYLTAPEMIVDGQGFVTYDNTKLRLVSMELPKIADMLWKNESVSANKARFSFSELNAFDFTKGGEFVVLTFEVIGDANGTASVDLTIEELDATDRIYFKAGVAEDATVLSSLVTPTVTNGEPPTTESTPAESEDDSQASSESESASADTSESNPTPPSSSSEQLSSSSGTTPSSSSKQPSSSSETPLPSSEQTSSSFVPTESSTPTVTDPPESDEPSSQTPTESKTPSTDPTESKTPNTDPTESKIPGTNPTESKTPGTDPTESKTPSTDPTESETSGTTPTETQTPTTEPATPTPTQPSTKAPATQNTTAKPAENVGKGADGAAVDSAIRALNNDKDPKGSTFNHLQVKNTSTTGKSIKITYKKPSTTKTFVIYGNRCGKKYKVLKKTTAKTFTYRNLKKGKYYKFLVVALDKNNKVVATSKTIHVATKGGKNGNPSKVKITNTSKIKKIAKGTKIKIKTRVISPKNVTVKTHRRVKFESTKPAVVKVSSDGQITAKKKGSATIYAYAQNGVMAKVKIKVK